MEAIGKLIFDPKPLTDKVKNRMESHKYCLLVFKGEICEYYSWWLKKKGLNLIHPVSGPHITVVSEKTLYLGGKSLEEKENNWKDIKNKFNGLEVPVEINVVNYYSNSKHWWLKLEKESEQELLIVRELLGLGKPKFSLHFTLGYVNDRPENVVHSEYLSKILLDK